MRNVAKKLTSRIFEGCSSTTINNFLDWIVRPRRGSTFLMFKSMLLVKLINASKYVVFNA